MSSNAVASVMYDPSKEELRLCGGEGSVSRLSDPIELVTRFLSPVPLSKLGDPETPEADCRVRTP